MNRQAITQASKDFLLEYKGDTGAESPFVWPVLVTQAANDVARRTNSFYSSITRNLAQGVSDYSPSFVYAPKRITVQDGSGNTVLLLPMTVNDLNNWGSVMGFTGTTGAYNQGVPSQYIWLAANLIRILPVPNYTVVNGLTIEGLSYPAYTWPDSQDECPLPQESHLAVVYRAALLRSAQFPDADNKARCEQIAAVYETEVTAAKEILSQTAKLQDEVDTAVGFMGAI